MSYNLEHLIAAEHLKKLAQRVQARISAVENSLASNVTASTDSNADYAAELVDARIDAAGNAHASGGANIRYWQGSLTEANEYIQEQVNELSEVYLEVLAQTGQIESRLRELES